MNRLTAQWGENPAVPTKLDLAKFLDFSEDIWADFDDIIQRLAAYENTGLTPKEVQQLEADLRKASHGNCNMCAFDGKNQCWGNIMVGLKDLRQELKDKGCPYCKGWEWRRIQE